MKSIILSSVLFLTACTHPYSLQPITETPEKLNGIELNTLVTKKCVLQAGYQDSTTDEMLIRIKVLNKSEGPFDIDFSSFSLAGLPESIKDSPLAAQDPDKYLKDLSSLAELQDSRTKMETYQGIDALGSLGGEKSDHQIDVAKDQYLEKQKDAEKSRKNAILVRKRIEMMQPLLLRKTTVKSGASTEGVVVLKAAFKNEGVVTLESTHSACQGELRFLLKK